MDLQLSDQVAFVAGSSRGIGLAIAAALLREGARVVLTGRDETALRVARDALGAHAASERLLSVAGDLTRPDAIAHAMDRTMETFGRLDHLVANVGTGSGMAGCDLPDEEWQRLFELNFFGSVRLTQGALPRFAAARGGSILFITSIVAIEATEAPLPYAAAKAALMNYAKNLSRRLAPQGVRVNSIAPGNIYFEGGSWERHLTSDRARVDAMLAREVPLGRFGRPDEVASLAAYLCSSLAGFATGASYVVDGGQTRALA